MIGAAADPAALGVAALLLGHADSAYAAAADRQYHTLTSSTPRLRNGAISHREREAEAWADFVYMVPPFLAYYGVYRNDQDIVNEAAQQCLLYRDILQSSEPGTEGLWHHIIGPKHEDRGFWGTGNAWAAAGMTRVLAVLVARSKPTREPGGVAGERLSDLKQQLLSAIFTILDAVMSSSTSADPSNGLLRNYQADPSWFGEIAATALLASVPYRLALLLPSHADVLERHLQWAEDSRKAVMRCVDEETGNVAPVVNPMTPLDREPLEVSPEGQAFVLLLHASHRDWVSASDRQ